MSDDLEFHIQELDRKVEAMVYKGDQNGSASNGTIVNGQIDVPDRNNLVSRDGGRGDTENEETRPGPFLKRGST